MLRCVYRRTFALYSTARRHGSRPKALQGGENRSAAAGLLRVDQGLSMRISQVALMRTCIQVSGQGAANNERKMQMTAWSRAKPTM